MISARFATRGTAIGVLCMCLACAPSGSRQSSGPQLGGVVVSPLSVQVADPQRLLSVNSIFIEKPSFRMAARPATTEDGLYSIVSEVAAETLSMDVTGGAQGGKGSSQADSILRTEVVVMEDLKGSSVGGEPARVAFRMGIYAAKDLRAVWESSYVYQQEAISDNWLKLGDRLGRDGSGAGWISANEIFKRGVTRSLQDFNTRRDSQFQIANFGK